MAAPVVCVASPQDRQQLETLIDQCYSIIYPGWYDDDLLTDALPAMLRIDTRLLESGHYFFATVEGKSAGCGGWSVAAPSSSSQVEDTGHIRHFATHPDFMRKGVGSAILSCCLKEANAQGVETLQCFSSLPGQPFYAQHGFKPIDEVNIMMGDGIIFPAILMERHR